MSWQLLCEVDELSGVKQVLEIHGGSAGENLGCGAQRGCIWKWLQQDSLCMELERGCHRC